MMTPTIEMIHLPKIARAKILQLQANLVFSLRDLRGDEWTIDNYDVEEFLSPANAVNLKFGKIRFNTNIIRLVQKCSHIHPNIPC